MHALLTQGSGYAPGTCSFNHQQELLPSAEPEVLSIARYGSKFKKITQLWPQICSSFDIASAKGVKDDSEEEAEKGSTGRFGEMERKSGVNKKMPVRHRIRSYTEQFSPPRTA